MAVEASPQRVVSINICADELLLLLGKPEQIVSISYLSKDDQYSPWADKASDFPINYAGAEEIINQHPDLVLAGEFSDPMVLRLLRQQGIEVVSIKRAQTFSQLFDATLQVGDLLGRRMQAEQLVKQWQIQIDDMMRGLSTDKPSMAMIGPNGYTEGQGTLRDQLLVKAGIVNVASSLNMVGNAEFTLEQILEAQPDLIAIEDSTRNRHSLAQRLLTHPALRVLSSLRVSLPASLWSCPGPSYVTALKTLIDAKQRWLVGAKS